jgi:ABC-type glutathione transport system ATPase component
MNHGGRLAARHVSEGTILALGLLTAAHTSRGPTVLLIDDIDKGLHPQAQARLVACIRALQQSRPDLQVICTTHSPLVALGAAEGQLIALHRDAKGITARQPGDLSAYSAEDALVSEALFGTDPFAPHTRRKLDRRDKLAAVPADERTERQTADLRKVSAELSQSAEASLGDDPVVRQLRALQDALRAGTAE